MKRTSLCCGLAMLMTCATAQTTVSPYTPGATIDGVTYYLPQTAIRIVVTAEKQTFTPGELNKYAYKYMRMSDVGNEPSIRWSIKDISMNTYGVRDPKKAYNIRLEKRTVAPLVSLTKDGIILAINSEAEETTLPSLPIPTASQPHPNPQDFMNQDILVAGSKAKVAELIAEEIYDLRESRSALIKGEADNTPKDGTQLQIMLNQLNLQEKVLTQMFAGKTDTCTEVFTIELTPTACCEKTILFRFSEKLGRVDKDDLAGEPVYLTLKDLNTLPEPVIDEKADKKKAKMEQGVYYNVPERIGITIFSPQTIYCKGEYPMGQFGNVEILSNILFDKKTTTKVTFHQDNGGIKQLTDEFTE